MVAGGVDTRKRLLADDEVTLISPTPGLARKGETIKGGYWRLERHAKSLKIVGV